MEGSTARIRRRRRLAVGRLGAASAFVVTLGAFWATATAMATTPIEGFMAWAPPAAIDSANTLEAVSCPAVWMCVAVDNAGNVVTSTDPSGGARAWTVTHIDSDTVGSASATLTAVSCPSVSLCVAVDNVGALFSSTDPTAGASSWTLADRIAVTGFTGVSCPSVALCAAVDQSGDGVTSTDPGTGPGAWQTARLIPPSCQGTVCGETLPAVSCPSASLCVTSAWNGDLLSSTNPSGGPGAWTSAHVDSSVLDVPPPNGSPAGISWISCPSTSLCVATDGVGNVLTSQNPAGGAGAWTVTDPADGESGGPNQGATMPLSCPSISFCVVLGDPGQVNSATPGELATSDTPLSGSSWSEATVSRAGLMGVSCPSVTFCAVVDTSGNLIIGRVPLLSPSTIAELLRGALAESGRPSLGYLLHVKAFTLSFRPPAAGTVLLRWLVPTAGAGSRDHGELLAEGQAQFAAGTAATIGLQLTSAGEAQLRHRVRLPVTAEATFTPVGGQPVTATQSFTLRR